ncbi:MAG: hypothetical protein ACKVTZ_09795 [Bacteroidia bacterium]
MKIKPFVEQICTKDKKKNWNMKKEREKRYFSLLFLFPISPSQTHISVKMLHLFRLNRQ